MFLSGLNEEGSERFQNRRRIELADEGFRVDDEARYSEAITGKHIDKCTPSCLLTI